MRLNKKPSYTQHISIKISLSIINYLFQKSYYALKNKDQVYVYKTDLCTSVQGPKLQSIKHCITNKR